MNGFLIDLDVPADVLAARRAALAARPRPKLVGTLRKYAALVQSAHVGATA